MTRSYKDKNGRSAKKRAPDTAEKKTYGIVFINIPLRADDERALDDFSEKQHDVTSFILESVENGYKMSIGPDKRNDCYIASMTGRDCIEENRDKCLTARGSTPDEAVLCLWYKYSVHCIGGVFPAQAGKNNTSRWG